MFNISLALISILRSSIDNIFIKIPLRAISGIVYSRHSCRGKRGKLSGSRLSTISKFASKQFFKKKFRQKDISAFSGQNKVTKMCPKYILTGNNKGYCK